MVNDLDWLKDVPRPSWKVPVNNEILRFPDDFTPDQVSAMIWQWYMGNDIGNPEQFECIILDLHRRWQDQLNFADHQYRKWLETKGAFR